MPTLENPRPYFLTIWQRRSAGNRVILHIIAALLIAQTVFALMTMHIWGMGFWAKQLEPIVPWVICLFVYGGMLRYFPLQASKAIPALMLMIVNPLIVIFVSSEQSLRTFGLAGLITLSGMMIPGCYWFFQWMKTSPFGSSSKSWGLSENSGSGWLIFLLELVIPFTAYTASVAAFRDAMAMNANWNPIIVGSYVIGMIVLMSIVNFRTAIEPAR